MHPTPPELHLSDALTLRLAELRDVPALVRFYRENQRHLWRWQAISPDLLDPVFWSARVLGQRQRFHRGEECRVFLFNEQEVVGKVALFGITRGAAQSAWLAYELALSWTGRGLMTQAVRALLGYATTDLRLHRIQAQYHPDNQSSARLLDRLGFQPEGRLPRALFVHGEWTDQILVGRELENTAPIGHFRWGETGIEAL